MKPLHLYGRLASWWHLFSDPSDYREEAAWTAATLRKFGGRPASTVLELGSGGGNNAFHLKKKFVLTLVDRSPGMLASSRRINPDCEHIRGDIRTVRLDRAFDRVFVHDAIMYMTSEDELLKVIRTAFHHCRPGGAAVFIPDFVRETYQPLTHHGGHDGKDRAIRYLEWNFDPEESDHTYEVHFSYLLRDSRGRVSTAYDVHTFGLFPRKTWFTLMERAGFQGYRLEEPWGRDVFVGIRPRGSKP